MAITSIYQPTNAHIISHKTLLKHFKTLRHVSILSDHHQGALFPASYIIVFTIQFLFENEVLWQHIMLCGKVRRIRRTTSLFSTRHRSTAGRLLRLWVRIPTGAWMSVCCECCVLSGRGVCDALITRPEESYRLWCVVACDLETSRMRRPWVTLGCSATGEEKKSKLSN